MSNLVGYWLGNKIVFPLGSVDPSLVVTEEPNQYFTMDTYAGPRGLTNSPRFSPVMQCTPYAAEAL